MAITSHNSSSNWTLSVRIVLISASVLCTAVILKISVPVLTEFAVSELPSIWSFVVSWLRPPYLYVVINCIIITIVASSKLQNKLADDDYRRKSAAVHPAPVKVTADYAVVYDGVDVNVKNDSEVLPEFAYGYDAIVVRGSDFDVDERVVGVVPEMESLENKTTALALNAAAEDLSGGDEVAISRSLWSDFDVDERVVGVVPEVEGLENKTTAAALNAAADDLSGGDEVAISRSLWNAQLNSTEYSFAPYEKPPVSVRIGHRKTVKSSPEGGRTLGVSKPKRHETLENTWKTITEGRPMPLARHLRKSDTWETHGGHVGHHVPDHDHMMIKSETFNDRTTTATTTAAINRPPVKLRREPSGSGKLRREPSPSQDELNRRVEAFIKKFNEEMRLQRQESLNRYMEMINRGTH